jgi:endonuclease III
MTHIASNTTEGHELPPQEKIEWVQPALAQFYGDLVWKPNLDPLSELVLTILSQHTNDTNRDRAFASMRARYPTWEEVVEAPPEELADAIRVGGLGNIKAPRIQAVLRQIWRERGSWDLSFLTAMPVPEAKAWLSKFNGVGPKTAACVLMFGCGQPVFPVDTHIFRVSQRIGLIDLKTNAEKAHNVLEGMVPPEKRYTFHINLIQHGRKVCKAQRPLCELCVVREWCNYYNTLVKRG